MPSGHRAPTRESAIGAAALRYAARGWSVFPVKADKTPRTAHGFKDATTDPEQVWDWWEQWPDVGVAIRTGRESGLYVLDVDGDQGADTLHKLEREYGELPETVQAVTGGGGAHYFFRYPAAREQPNTSGRVGPGLDTRGEGGYVVVPPSSHSSGRPYEWDVAPGEAGLADPPAWLLQAAEGRRNGGPPPAHELIPEGQRNDRLFRLGCAMRRQGAGEAAITVALKVTNREQTTMPLPESEVARIAGSTVRYEPEPEGSASRVSSNDPDFPPAPEAMRSEAFHGPAGELVREIEPHSEADPAAVLVQLLLAFGNGCGRGPGFQVESDRHGTNEYAAIVGETSKARKGVSWNHTRRTMRLAAIEWEERCIGSGIASGEGLIHAVRDPLVVHRKAKTKEERARADEDGRIEDEVDPGVEEKRLLVIQGELVQVLRVMKKEGNTVSPILRDLWDHGNARSMSKNSPEKTTGSLVTVIGHITVRELRRELTETETANGFANRWLWVYARRSKRLPRGGRLEDSALEPLAIKVREALRFAQTQGMIGMTEDAWQIWEQLYAELDEGAEDDLLGAITARAEAHVRRLAVLYALLDQREIVEVEHLRAAIAVWDYCAASAAHIFGGTVGDPLTDKILEGIHDAGTEGLSRTDIRAIVGGHVPAKEIDAALDYLVVRGLGVEHVDPTSPKGGRRPHRYTFQTRSKPRGGSEETSREGGFAPKGDEVSSDSGGPMRRNELGKDDTPPKLPNQMSLEDQGDEASSGSEGDVDGERREAWKRRYQ